MQKYTFYVEYVEKQLSGRELNTGMDEIVVAKTMKEAIKKMARKKKLKFKTYEELIGGGYRTYFYKRKWFRQNREYIFYVETLNESQIAE